MGGRVCILLARRTGLRHADRQRERGLVEMLHCSVSDFILKWTATFEFFSLRSRRPARLEGLGESVFGSQGQMP